MAHQNGDNLDIGKLTTAVTVTKQFVLPTSGAGFGAAAPTDVTNGPTFGLKFAVGDQLYFFFSKPSDYDSGNVTLRLGFYPPASEAAKFVAWQIIYNARNLGQDVSVTTNTLLTGDVAYGATANIIQVVDLTIPAAHLANTFFSLRLQRVASVGASPTSPGNSPVVTAIQVLYTAK